MLVAGLIKCCKMDEYKFHEKFCAYPFVQLATDPRGYIVPCCWNNYNLGEIKNSSIEEIWNSEKMQALRSEFLTGEIKTCAAHIANRQCNRWSEKLFPLVKPAVKQDLSSIKVIYAQLNGKCNLECVMCDVWTFPNGLFTEEKFWSLAESKIFPSLKEIYISGGEPFIQKDTYRLVEKIYSVNKSCIFRFHTNGHWRFSDKIKAVIQKLNIGHISISIDSLDEKTYASIRLKGNLRQVLATLEDIFRFRNENARKFTIQIETAVQKDNYAEVESFVQFARAKQAKLIFSMVYMPEQVSLLNFTTPEKVRILNLFLKTFEKTREKTILDLIVPIANSLKDEEIVDFFRQRLNNSANGKFLFEVHVRLEHRLLTFTLASPDHRILNYRLGVKILTASDSVSKFYYTDEHDFWMNYQTGILPFAVSVELCDGIIPDNKRDEAIHISEDDFKPALNGKIPLSLEVVFKKFGNLGGNENRGKNALSAAYLIYMIQNDYAPDNADALLNSLVGFSHQLAAFRLNGSMRELDQHLEEWVDANPDKIATLEKFYSNELENWQKDSERERFLDRIQIVGSGEDVFRHFGTPGDVLNTGWFSLAAVSFAATEGKILDGTGLEALSRLIARLAPNFPRSIGYYFGEGRGTFVSDAKTWALRNPLEVKAMESAYKKAYEERLEEINPKQA